MVLEGDDIERFEQAQEEREVQARIAAAERGLNEDDEGMRVGFVLCGASPACSVDLYYEYENNENLLEMKIQKIRSRVQSDFIMLTSFNRPPTSKNRGQSAGVSSRSGSPSGSGARGRGRRERRGRGGFGGRRFRCGIRVSGGR